MSPPLLQIRNRILQSVGRNDTRDLPAVIDAAIRQTGRRAKKDRIKEINRAILEIALEMDRPDLISLLQEIQRENTKTLFSLLINQYITTKNDDWFTATVEIITGFEKKGDQSEVLARLSRMLIEAGSIRSDRLLIDKGIDLFSRITFRKYRSEILSQISPLLIEWAVANGDVLFLQSLYTLAEEVTDISRRSIIYAKLATGIAAIGITKGDLFLWTEGIRAAASIRQKTRRQTCFSTIVQAASASALFLRIQDISGTASLISDLNEELLLEVIGAILAQVLGAQGDRTFVSTTVTSLAKDLPKTRSMIVSSLLKQAERTGESWYFTQALELQDQIPDEGHYPVNEFVRAAISVFRTTGSTDALRHVVPAVISSCSPATASKILLQIVQVLLVQDDLSEALSVFMNVHTDGEKNQLYDECSVSIWKHAIITGRGEQVQEILEKQPDHRQWSEAIYRAVADICKQHAFSEIAEHAGALAAVMEMHSQRDQLVLDSINHLIHRGFLETSDPDVLIGLTRSIGDSVIRERALSTIVIRVAKMGVATRSRDFLQRAVGLSCLIEDIRTRSQTLTAVIDEATILAVGDGDIDLLRRMREWSASLLSKEGEIVAITNIINGMITYAGDRRYPGALDEAYRMAAELADPTLRSEVKDRISESYVRIGCVLVQELEDPPVFDDVISAFRLFLHGLTILQELKNQHNHSLKIAHVIDIIIDSSKERFRTDTVPALMLFALEIREGYERDAMVARIASLVRTLRDQTESNDQYEMIVQVLLRIGYIIKDPALLDLVFHTAEQIKDPFYRLSCFCQLAGLYVQAKRSDLALDLLHRVCSLAGEVTGTYRQVILFADCAVHYTRIAPEEARRTVLEARTLLRSTDYDPDAVAHGRLVAALVRLYDTSADEDLIAIALDVAKQIPDPSDYIAALLQVYRIVPDKPALKSTVVKQILQASGAISVPVQRASLLLDLADQMIRGGEETEASAILLVITDSIQSIPVPYLADSLRGRMIESYVRMWKNSGGTEYLDRASSVIGTIEHDEIRLYTASLNEKLPSDVPSLYGEVRNLAERMITERYSPAQVNGLENLVRSVADRGLIARHFCSIAILFNSTGKTQLARRFYEAALSEAGVIRPLSHRAYVQCDLALMLDHARCGEKAQMVMGKAFDTATGIRQFADRDEVFDNLSAAMRWMRED